MQKLESDIQLVMLLIILAIAFGMTMLYKDRLAIEYDSIGKNSQTHEEAVLEDISEKGIASRVQGNLENLDKDPKPVSPPL